MPKPPPKPSPEYPEGRYRRDVTGESIEGEEVLSHADYPAAQGRRMMGSAEQRSGPLDSALLLGGKS